jgi:hypothetical protein
LSLNTNIVKAAIITAASNTRKPREAIARAALNVSEGLTPGEVSDSNTICDYSKARFKSYRSRLVSDLRFKNLAPFTVFDSFSHPFLSCQCLNLSMCVDFDQRQITFSMYHCCVSIQILSIYFIMK